ncbi:uncharacterized protein ACNLHF_021927 isoform 2-T2 [Anomaloglossus baeobatrachus]|uniref:uncharacterized protein LOC142258841 isoform X2 n=1 Tax=Anomaloglossus baeobatrachus TaxID=238106 RepID=UPI003F4FD623
MDCPAKLYIYHIAIFPDFRIAQNTEKRRKMVSKKIKNSLDKLAPIHNYKIANFREKVDQRVRKKVRELYRGGLRTVSDIMIQLAAFVAKECFCDEVPERSRRRFYPTRKDIANIIVTLRQENRNSLLDQESIRKFVVQYEKQMPEDNIFFRENTTTDEKREKQKFLFCYQAQWQRKILTMYGSIVLLDATYRTTRYALPLYFLCVRTNVCYLIVGAFVTQEETSESIQEALLLFKSWNPDWESESFMVDFCLEEINALTNIFPGFGYL